MELPDHRFVTIQPLDDGDRLIDELIAENPSFQALLAKSASSGRKPFSFAPSPADQ